MTSFLNEAKLPTSAVSAPHLFHRCLSLSCYPEPISLELGWNALGTLAIVAVVALVLDFLAFRASELRHQKRKAQQQQQLRGSARKSSPYEADTKDAINPKISSFNGHGETVTPHDCNGKHEANGGGRCNKSSGIVEVEVRPAGEAEVNGNGTGGGGGGDGNSWAAAAHKSRVEMRRVFVLTAWMACAFGFHRCGARSGWRWREEPIAQIDENRDEKADSKSPCENPAEYSWRDFRTSRFRGDENLHLPPWSRAFSYKKLP